MLQEAYTMTGGNSHIQDEMREVEEELEEDSSLHETHNPQNGNIPLEALEEGKASRGGYDSSPTPSSPVRRVSRSGSPSPRLSRGGAGGPSIKFPLSNSMSGRGKSADGGKALVTRAKDGVRKGLQLLTSPVFAQAFVLTFLGEWGDRSQITTIAMGGAHVGKLGYQ
jgi:putative Ca2+/H+ antiporter (TMEM165/GDT1 family)